jgi:hypothetical protein
MTKRATSANWESYYQRQARRRAIDGDVYQRALRRKERWERVMFVAFGAYLVLITVAFAVLR